MGARTRHSGLAGEWLLSAPRRSARGHAQGLPPTQYPTPAGSMPVLSQVPLPQSPFPQQNLPQLPSGPGRQVEPPLQWAPPLLGPHASQRFLSFGAG